jgi:multicomponent Na+:H+ antiporter subunit D
MIAILGVTSEWSQRSGLTSFTLVPSRGRVIGAKAIATFLVGIVSMAVAFAVGALSVAGVPPTAGFVGKLAVFRSAVEESGPALVAVLVLGSGLSMLYMFQAYQHAVWRGEDVAGAPSRGHVAAVCALLAVVVALGLWPEPLLAVGDHAAAAIEGNRP